MTLSPPLHRLFLNVEHSALDRAWRDRLDYEGQARALTMAQHHGFSDILSRVLAGRGVHPDQAQAFLDPTLRDLMPDPDTLAGMGQAVARIVRAVQNGETVAIFGDYDVDGASSAALLGDYFRHCGTPFLIHIPDRIFEGYGPNPEAIRALKDKGANLLITVDCGTTSHETLALAASLGLDPIVLDHHQAPEVLPEAIIVNPNRLDDLSHLGHLCAAGVVFMTLVAVNRELKRVGFFTEAHPAPDLLKGLDLVALATVADVAPLIGLNRAFVTKGLQVMRARERAGLRALVDIAGADGPPKPYHLGFLIGPRINAGGRIGDAALGAKLLMLEDDEEARAIATELDRLNRERQTIEVATVEVAEAEALGALGLEEKGAVVITAAEGWHPGVVGLVASRLKERFRRPAFAIAMQGKTGTGSGRSITGVDLGRVVRLAVEQGLLIKGGGHAMAAGITIARENLGAFRSFMEEKLSEKVEAARSEDSLLVDAALTAGGASPELMHGLEKAGPFGAANPEPVFAFPNHRLVDAALVGANHIRFRLTSGDGSRIDGIAFRAAEKPLGQALMQLRGETVHAAGTLSLDRWGGRERVQLRLLDIAKPSR